MRQVGISLQPQRDRTGHEGSRLRSAFHQTVPRFVSPSAHRSRQEQVFIAGIEALCQFVLRTVDERTGSQHGGFEIVLVEERAVGRETGDVAHFLLADLFALVVGVRGIGTYGDGAGDGGRTFAHDVLVVGLERCRLVVFHGALRNAGRKTIAVHPHVEVFCLFVVGFRRDLEADFHIDVVGRSVFLVFVTRDHGIFPSRAEIQEIAVQFAVVVGVDHAEFAALVDHFFPIFGRLREHFAARIEEGRDFEVGCAVGRAAPDVYVGVELIFRLAVDHTLEIDIDQQVFGFAGREGGLRMDVQVTFVADGRRDESAAAVQEFVDALVIVRRAVVRARLTAETHVDHPRLFGLLGIFLHEFHILHDFRVVKRGGNHDDVGFGRHAFQAGVADFAARRDVRHVRGVSRLGFREVGAGRDHSGGAGVLVLGGFARIARTIPEHLHARIFRRGVEKRGVAEFKTLVDDADHDPAAGERGVETRARVHLGYARIGARFVERRAEATGESEAFHLGERRQRVERRGGHGGRHHGVGDHGGRSAQSRDVRRHVLGRAFHGRDAQAQRRVDVHHTAAQAEVRVATVGAAACGTCQCSATLYDLADRCVHFAGRGGLLCRALQRVAQATEQEEAK